MKCQSFRVQCPMSTITHPVAANNDAEPTAVTGRERKFLAVIAASKYNKRIAVELRVPELRPCALLDEICQIVMRDMNHAPTGPHCQERLRLDSACRSHCLPPRRQHPNRLRGTRALRGRASAGAKP